MIRLALLAVTLLSAQNIRVKVEKDIDLTSIKTFRVDPGFIHGRHYKLNETTLRQNLENHLAARVATVLRPAATPDAIVTYSLRANDDKDNRKRPRDITRYTLEIRILDTARRPLWTAVCTGTVDDRRQQYVERHLQRAVTLAIAKYRQAQ
ncbi:MAG: DUF4136 domain-containing protein [Acidobacteria bacterium]|nr:DUF4136 domain-containing protein [Acidobacteriota bacterium]